MHAATLPAAPTVRGRKQLPNSDWPSCFTRGGQLVGTVDNYRLPCLATTMPLVALTTRGVSLRHEQGVGWVRSQLGLSGIDCWPRWNELQEHWRNSHNSVPGEVVLVHNLGADNVSLALV